MIASLTAALIAFLLSLIALIAILIYIWLAKNLNLHILDRIMLPQDQKTHFHHEYRPAPHPQTPFRRTPLELGKLKQQLRQLKYAHSVGAVKKDEYETKRNQLHRRLSHEAHRRENI